MLKPTNKAELLEDLEKGHQLLMQSVAKLSIDDLLSPATWGKWSYKDMLAHITDWEVRIFSWYLAGLRGEMPITPDPDFDWDHIDDLNHAIYLKHRDEPLDEVLADFDLSWQETLRLVRDMPADHLYKKGKFAWLGEYLWADVMLGSTTHHYLGHLKDVQAWLDKNAEK